MTRTATQMARLQEAAQYFPVYTRPLPDDIDESQPLRRGCFACQHTGKSSFSANDRFATVWFHAVNTGKKKVANLIQPLGALVVNLTDNASKSVNPGDPSIIPLLREAATTFPKLWIYYITANSFEEMESPYVRLFADRNGNVDHINSRLSLWKNLLTKTEQMDKPTDITMTIQGNWGKGIYLDPSIQPKGLAVRPNELITATKQKQTDLLKSLQGEQQLTRITPLADPTKPSSKTKKTVISPKTSYADFLQSQVENAIHATTWGNTSMTWDTTTPGPWDISVNEEDEDAF